ncbi:MAG: hypothetical protein JW800_05550 [Candidatus Omnitrophica bacterium]|nr:hypothetical protein [Candidatus Omnitrophota bacterium]
MKPSNVAIIIQARMSSSRFPSKMMEPLGGAALIEFVYKRSTLSNVSNVVVATSEDLSDRGLYDYCLKNSIRVMRGSLEDVLKRYIDTANAIGAKYIIRICGDTPFVDIALADSLLDTLVKEGREYVAPSRISCASAFFSEAVSLSALERCARMTSDKQDREHVTRYILNHADGFDVKLIDAGLNPSFMSDVKLTIDYPEDIEAARRVVGRLADRYNFSSGDVLDIVGNKRCVG